MIPNRSKSHFNPGRDSGSGGGGQCRPGSITCFCISKTPKKEGSRRFIRPAAHAASREKRQPAELALPGIASHLRSGLPKPRQQIATAEPHRPRAEQQTHKLGNLRRAHGRYPVRNPAKLANASAPTESNRPSP